MRVADRPGCCKSIIFVPGLGGDYIETWQADDEPGTVWPRDLLPVSDPDTNVKVISFKYNTSLNGTTSQAGIRDHAKDLLDRLVDEREDDEAASLRPLVFVGHSLGGIVIKRVRRQYICQSNSLRTSSADSFV
jgi:triacylglycerol esterase/lipase EstA (alpha/beta hydrolase family)